MTPGTEETSLIEELTVRLADLGLILRGGFHPVEEDGAPDGTATLLLIGNAGPALWRRSGGALGEEAYALDAWTQRVMEPIAGRFGAKALYPFGGPPYHPFQRWAKRAEGLHSSPLGMLIHPEYGLWHAYRAALCFAGEVAAPARATFVNPCEACADKPCLSTCPVAAFSVEEGYDVPACAGHLKSSRGEDCMTLGCRARRACPIGRDMTYDPDQAAFHMRAFLRARRS